VRQLRVSKGGVAALCFLPDGRLVSGGSTGEVVAWELATGRGETWFRVPSTSATPDGGRRPTGTPGDIRRLTPVAGDRLLAEPFVQGDTVLWNHATGQRIDLPPLPLGAWDRYITMSSDGARIAYLLTAPSGVFAAVRDILSGESRAMRGSHFLPVLTLSPRGDRLVVISASGEIDRDVGPLVFDAATGEELARVAPSRNRTGHLCWSPDGRRLVVEEDTHVRLRDAATGEEVLALPGPAEAFAFTPDGRSLVTAGDGPTVTVWDLDTGTPRTVLDTGVRRVRSLAVAPDGLTVACGSGNRIITLIDLEG
jgi:WD40 repeat protein